MRTQRGFTLVEAVVALALASILIVGVMSYFGFSLRTITHREDILTASRDVQVLLSYLRMDISAAEGLPGSTDATTGTTYPKLWVHLAHSPDSDLIHGFTRIEDSPGEPLSPQAPVTTNLPPGLATERVLTEEALARNAFAWVPRNRPDGPDFFFVNVRRGPQVVPIVYMFDEAKKTVTRHAPEKTTVIAPPALEGFEAVPTIEFVTFPDQPARTAVLSKVWAEVSIRLRAPQAGKVIASRLVGFSTRIVPIHLNAALKSRWAP